MYRKSIPIIWHHVLDVKDVNLQLLLELWPTVTFSTEPVLLPACRAESLQAEKVVRKIYYFFFLFLSLKYLFFFLDNY